MGIGTYSTISSNMMLVHWPLMGGLLHLVQRGGDWTGPQPAQAPPCCTKCNSPPVIGQCTNILLYNSRCSAVLMCALKGYEGKFWTLAIAPLTVHESDS